jgi:hypothetical protein
LTPVLQIHLLDFASSKPLVQRMGQNRLELCMIVIEELRDTLFGAEIISRMFGKAHATILKRKSASSRTGSRQDVLDGLAGADACKTVNANDDTALGETDSNETISMAFETLNQFPLINLDGIFGEEYVASLLSICEHANPT